MRTGDATIAAWAATLLVLAAGCDDAAGDGACAPDEARPACAPLYEPTFANLYERTLRPTCSAGGGSCHAAEGAQAGLVLDDADVAHALLVEAGRVTPGAPSCSLLMERLDATGAAQAMPPGQPLSEAERCVFRLWVWEGAQR